MKLGLLSLVLATVLAYHGVATADFVYEDHADPHPVWAGWAIELSRVADLTPRSLTNLTWHAQGRQSAGAYHVGNLAVHVVNGLLMAALLAPLGSSVALGASAIWLLHPLQSEAVNYVSARTDLLVATAILIALIATRWAAWIAVPIVVICGALAVLAKESGLVIVGLVPLLIAWQQRAGFWRLTLPIVAVWGPGAVFALERVLPADAHGVNRLTHGLLQFTPASGDSALWYAARQLTAIGRLLGLVVWPFGFTVDHDWERMPDGAAIVAVVGLVALIALAWTVRSRCPVVAFALAWVLVALGPRFVIPLPDLVNEHQVYVPMIGIVCLIGVTWRAVLAAGLAFAQRSGTWVDEWHATSTRRSCRTSTRSFLAFSTDPAGSRRA